MPSEKLKNIIIIYRGEHGYPVKVHLQTESFASAESVVDSACFKMGMPTRILSMRDDDETV